MTTSLAVFSPPPLLVNMHIAAEMCGLTRSQLWRIERDHIDVPIMHLGPRKRLVNPIRLLAWIEGHFLPGSDAPAVQGIHAEKRRRSRGHSRRSAPVAIAAGAKGGAQ